MSLPAPATLLTPRLRLRPVAEADLPDLLEVNGDDATTRYLPYPSWRSLDDAQAWLQRIAARQEAGDTVQYVVVAGEGLPGAAPGRVIGSCLLFRHDADSARAEIGYALARPHWGRGLAREAVGALLAHGLAAGLRRVEAVVDPRNEPSAKVLERLGFVREGLLRANVVCKGELCDSALYGLLADERPAEGASGLGDASEASAAAVSPPDAIRDTERLQAMFGPVSAASVQKEADHLHPVYRRWIAASPFAVLATCGPEGLDASPRGDPAPLVRMPDAHTLWLPERRGNNRVDSLRNIVRDPRVALLFMIPGVGETLRVNGRARVRTDAALREQCAIDGAVPACVIEVRVERVYFQCARALQRSALWPAGQPRPAVPTPGEMLAALTGGAFDGEAYDRALPGRQRATLY